MGEGWCQREEMGDRPPLLMHDCYSLIASAAAVCVESPGTNHECWTPFKLLLVNGRPGQEGDTALIAVRAQA